MFVVLVAVVVLGLFFLPLLITLFLVLFLVIFFLMGLFLINENQVGILTRKMMGQKMPPGQVIARKGEIGVLATVLNPGLYWRLPIVWRVQKAPLIEIPEDQVAMVEAIDGRPLQKGRLLGDEVECNQFQDAEAFLRNGGYKGPQVGILRPGKYRINVRAFSLSLSKAVSIPAENIGIVTALDGRPLPPRFILAPPVDPDPKNPNARSHNFFQDGQAFIDTGGYRGPQIPTLQPGNYYINPLLFDVETVPIQEVPPGFVAVLRSNIGEQLERSDIRPTPVSMTPDFDQTITSEMEKLLTDTETKRGILRAPRSPGKYNMNTVAYTAYLVPTSAIMVDWASSPVPGSPSMSRPSTRPTEDTSRYPYLDQTTGKGTEWFKFEQLRVTSKDGFQLEVDVRVVIRILPENAAIIIARFGSVFNLIQQIVHPLIDAEFRNSAGEKKALEFVQNRSQLQQEALEKARTTFARYFVEAQNLLISYIKVDQTLLATQTEKEIALQQQAQYEQQALAAEKQIAVREKTAIAEKQPQVVQARLDIDINANKAVAAVKEAEGVRDATRIRADGDSAAIVRVGTATADAYHAQADVVGAERVALIKVFEEIREGKIVITPQSVVSVTGGGGESEGGTQGALFSAFLASLLSGKATLPGQPFRPTERDDYRSPLGPPPSQATAPATTSAPSPVAALPNLETPMKPVTPSKKPAASPRTEPRDE